MRKSTTLIALAAATAGVIAPAAANAATTSGDAVTITSTMPSNGAASVNFADPIVLSGNASEIQTWSTGPAHTLFENNTLIMQATGTPVTYTQSLNVDEDGNGKIDGTASNFNGATTTISINGGAAQSVNGTFSVPAPTGLGATKKKAVAPQIIQREVKVAKGKLASGRLVNVTARITNPDASVKNWWSQSTINKVVRKGVNGGYEMPFRAQGFDCRPTVKGNTASFKCFLRGADVPTAVRLTFTANYA